MSALLRAFGGFEKQSAQIGIAHAGKGELSAADGSQQLIVGLSEGVESAIGAATVTDRLTDSGCLFSKRSCTGHTSKGFEITVIGLMGDLGSSVKIGYAAAQSHSFGPLFESGSDLTFKERMNFASGFGMTIAQKAHDIGTLEGFDCVVDKLPIKGLKIFRVIEEDIRGVLTLRSAPVIMQALHPAGDLLIQRMAEGKPGLDPYMQLPKLRVCEVVIQMGALGML